VLLKRRRPQGAFDKYRPRRGISLEYNFDIFEKFPDGKIQWRGCVASVAEAQLKLGRLAKWSKNDFYATELASGAVVASASAGRKN
jgi:hypothetical protein